MRLLSRSEIHRRAAALLGLCFVLTSVCTQGQDSADAVDHAEHRLQQPTPGAVALAHQHMSIDRTGSVMNNNDASLPRDCFELGPDIELTVRAGREHALGVPGKMYGYSEHEYRAEPCSRITVTFVNDDSIRHQWMIHGLPKYLYPGGMFHLEAAGGESRTGSFIVPSDDRTYLVHCDMTQHMEKGMKAQLIVGNGSGDLWSVPGVSGDLIHDVYLPDNSGLLVLLSMVVGLSVTALVLTWRHFF
ncbi:MAG: copper oxidase [Gammaproteobacteria bacterium]|jgi:plastocyanin